MQESVTYQAILEKGVQQGLEQGRQREVTLILRLLNRRFSEIEPALEERLRRLSMNQLEDLGVALLDFQEISDLTAWLNRHLE